MALEAGINQDAVNIARAIHHYAKLRGWSQDDYHIFITYNNDFSTLGVLVLAKDLDDRDEEQEFKDYDDVKDVIEAQAKPKLQVTNYYSLVLRGLKDFAFYPSRHLGPPEYEIDEKLINNGVSWSEPFPSTHR
jgi:hypothetical protein